VKAYVYSTTLKIGVQMEVCGCIHLWKHQVFISMS